MPQNYEAQIGEDEVDASATKEFFIETLTKDISLLDAIKDLADNSVDGARNLRGEAKYDGLSVKIDFNAQQFRILDNCGGITVDNAKQHVFRFGRNLKTPSVKRSVGQFGVGMKRALFKLGNEFVVQSSTEKETFRVKQNVPAWVADAKHWVFPFESLTPIKDVGTTITITELHTEVKDSFNSEYFKTQICTQLEAAHRMSMDKGLSIVVNGIPLHIKAAQILNSYDLKPAIKSYELKTSGKPNIRVRLVAGLGYSNPAQAGWYLVFNGRQILQNDTTTMTGWGENNGKTIPRFHNQFSRFRGFVFVDTDDTKRLPWNSTKTGVDLDSAFYKSLRQDMVLLMRPVIDFLNELKDEGENPERASVRRSVESASSTNVATLDFTDQPFKKPAPIVIKPSILMQNVSFKRPYKAVMLVRTKIGASSFREVGEQTFDYFFERECE